jgi:MFS family permease
MYARKATLLGASCLTVMSGATITPALPGIRAHFADVPDIGWWCPLVLTVPSLFVAIGSQFAGPVVDRWGRKPILLGGALLYAVAGTAGLWLDTLGWLLASRAVLGIAVAGVMTSATTLIGDEFEGEERSRLLGLQAAAMGLGGILFLLAGGALADVSWRGPFLVYFASLGVLPAGLLFLAEPGRRDAGLERTAGNARIGRPGTVALVNGLGVLGMVVFFMIPTRLPFHLEDLTGASRFGVGGVIALGTVFSAVTSAAYPRINRRLGFGTVSAIMLGLFGVGHTLIGVATGTLVVVAGVAASGLATGLLLPNLNTWLLSEAPEGRRGRLVGWLNSAFFLGQFLSPIVVAPLVAWSGIDGAFLGVGIAMGAAAVMATVGVAAIRGT